MSHHSSTNKSFKRLSTVYKLHTIPLSLTLFESECAPGITTKDINKVSGLRRLHITEFIAFSNDINVQYLFEYASYSVCVEEYNGKKWANKIIFKQEVAQIIEALKKPDLSTCG